MHARRSGRGTDRELVRSGLSEQLNELIAGEPGALDDPQRQPMSQITVMPGHNHTAVIAGTPQDDVTARLVVNLEAGALYRTTWAGFTVGRRNITSVPEPRSVAR
jgi:hypothetical protein